MNETKRTPLEEERLERLRDSTHCPVARCGGKTASTQLMCFYHWKRVPHDLQTKVWRTARKMWSGDRREVDAWKEAALKAIAAVEDA